MREISEAEAYEMAGDADCPVLRKDESDPMEAAICLKRFPQGYILGVSDKANDLRIWFTTDLAMAEEHYDRYLSLMREHGTPFMRLLYLALTAGFLAGLLGATPAAAQEQPAIAKELAGDLAQRGAITWTPDRRLVWADFRAAPPAGASNEGAQTVSGFLYAMQCDRKHLEYGVLTLFQPSESWVQPVVLTDSTQSHVLPHEQGHFNISELSARLLRADLLAFKVPCEGSDTVFARMTQAGFEREQSMQARYDEETVHGTIATEQARWMNRIATGLDSLSFVSVPFVSRKY